MGDRAAELMDKAEKKTKKFFGGSQKYQDARDLYEQAANQYKKTQDWPGAAGAWMKCYEMDQKLKCEMDLLEDLTQAAKCYRKFDVKEASRCVDLACTLHDKNGRFDRSAKMCMDCAAVVEQKIHDGDSGEVLEDLQRELLEWYTRSRDYFKLNKHSTSNYNDCIAKIADIKVSQGMYQDAVDMFEELARHCAEDNLLRFNAKGYFFTALLAQLAMAPSGNDDGIEPFRRKFEEYTSIDLQFSESTHEHMLCKAIIQAFEDENVKTFTDAQRAYERVNTVTRNREVLLMKGKAALKADTRDEYT